MHVCDLTEADPQLLAQVGEPAGGGPGMDGKQQCFRGGGADGYEQM
ncbi:MAG TPA: hypothetical protein VF288_08105 [Mycobacteriales bacterium]